MNNNYELVAKIKQLKQQGLSYYQASQQLQEQGFLPAQIDEVSYVFTNSKVPRLKQPADKATIDALMYKADADGTEHTNEVISELGPNIEVVPGAGWRGIAGTTRSYGFRKLGQKPLTKVQRLLLAVAISVTVLLMIVLYL